MEKITKKEKVLIGISLVSIGVAGYFGYKYVNSELARKLLEKDLEIANKSKNDIENRLNFIEFLVIESNSIPMALQNGNNKLSRVQSKITTATERLILKPNDKDAQQWLENNKAEEAKLLEYIAKAMKLDEAVKADQNIYAK